jgi:hypothetical protein
MPRGSGEATPMRATLIAIILAGVITATGTSTAKAQNVPVRKDSDFSSRATTPLQDKTTPRPITDGVTVHRDHRGQTSSPQPAPNVSSPNWGGANMRDHRARRLTSYKDCGKSGGWQSAAQQKCYDMVRQGCKPGQVLTTKGCLGTQSGRTPWKYVNGQWQYGN